MHETRYDWLADRWVIFAPNREERPNEYCVSTKPTTPLSRAKTCPFCSGAEGETPEPTLVLPRSDSDATRTLYRNERDRKGPSENWRVRVVPNKFPAISRAHQSKSIISRCDSSSPDPNHPLHRRESVFSHERGTVGERMVPAVELAPCVATLLSSDVSHLFQRQLVSGVHEVIIESPDHADSLTELPLDQIDLVLSAYQLRLSHWRSLRGLQYAVVFKNYGADAGASLSHSHSQLMCLDFTPSRVEWTFRRLSEYHRRYRHCYYCQTLHEELRSQERVVMESDYFVVICPFASRFPYCFSILPRTHRAHFDEISEGERNNLAEVLKKMLVALEASQPYSAYNYIVQTAPFNAPDFEAHHWRLRVIPRLNKVAGFEWGSDCFINTVKPEVAARVLRSNLPGK